MSGGLRPIDCEWFDVEKAESNMRSIGEHIEWLNRCIASACAMPLRVLDPQRWRQHRRAQRAARKLRRLRRARRGW